MNFSVDTSLCKFVPKVWGYEKWIVNNQDYCGKILFFVKGKMSSWHFHKLKKETFYVQYGSIELMYSLEDSIESAESIILYRGDKIDLPIGLRHRIIALEDTELIEFSTQHFDEDSHRIIHGG
jgi:mannose-6-phosphate isomerase-like protein (cupin superfamily)